MHQDHERKAANSAAILYVIGTDEAGRGPLAGPVATAATCFKLARPESSASDELFQFLGDSKVLTEALRREAVSHLLGSQEEVQRYFSFASSEGSDVFVSVVPPNGETGLLFLGGALRLVSAATIDERNILEASLDGMCLCAAALMKSVNACCLAPQQQPLMTPENTVVLVDGPHVPWGLMDSVHQAKKLASMLKGLQRKAALKRAASTSNKKCASDGSRSTTKQKENVCVPTYDRGDIACLSGVRGVGVVKGDALCPSIAAASVLAKVARDHFLEHTMHPAFPHYQFAAHKGYPTQLHMDLLQKHGACMYHRRSFGPVQKALAMICTGSEKAVVVDEPESDGSLPT